MKMKIKLLKKLRAKFIIEYFPSTKMYKVSGGEVSYLDKKSDAITQRVSDLLNYGRKYYEKYSKRIRI